MAERVPTRKRPSGRPGSSEEFKEWVATLVWFMIGLGEAGSRERSVALLTGRTRDGKAVGDGPQRLALPNGKKSHWTVHEMLRWADDNRAEMIAAARIQGEIAKAGGTLDEHFRTHLADIRAILANPNAVRNKLRAVNRKNLTKTL